MTASVASTTGPESVDGALIACSAPVAFGPLPLSVTISLPMPTPAITRLPAVLPLALTIVPLAAVPSAAPRPFALETRTAPLRSASVRSDSPRRGCPAARPHDVEGLRAGQLDG